MNNPFSKIGICISFSIMVFVVSCFILDKAILYFFIHHPVIKNFDFSEDKEYLSGRTGLRANYTGSFATSEYNITIKTNSLGFRDDEIVVKKPDNTFRILCLGDSFTFGLGVNGNSTFSKIFEQKLNNTKTHDRLDYEVVNAGWVASDPKQQLFFLKSFGYKFDPDCVVVGFFTGNDVLEILTNSMDKIESIEFTSNFLTALKIRKGAIGFIREIFEKAFPNLYDFAALKLIKIINKTGGRRHMFDYIMQKDYPQQIEDGWNKALKYLKEIKDFCDMHDFKLFILIIPFQEQLRDIKYNECIMVDRPQKILRDFFMSEDINFGDLLAHFKNIGSKDIYYIRDGHFNPRGHKVVADFLFDNFCFLKILPNNSF